MKVSLNDSWSPGDSFRLLKVFKKLSVQIKNRAEDKVLVNVCIDGNSRKTQRILMKVSLNGSLSSEDFNRLLKVWKKL